MNLPIVLTYLKISIALMCFIYAVLIVQMSTKDSAARFLGFTEAALGLWYFLAGFQKMISRLDIVMIMRSFVYVFSEFACVSGLVYSLIASSLTTWKNHKKITLLYLFPVFSLLVTAIGIIFLNINPYLKNPEPEVIRNLVLPIEDYVFPKKFLYTFHIFFCYATLSVCFIFFLKNILKNVRENLRALFFSVIGLILFTMPNLYHLIIYNLHTESLENVSPILESISFFLMCTLCFIAVYWNSSEKSICSAKNEFYDAAGLPMFILNQNKKLLQVNKVGEDFLKEYGIKIDKFDDYEKLFTPESVQILGIPESQDQENEFYISGVKDKKLYYAKITATKNESGSIIGYFVFLSKLDFYTGIIKQLEQTAYTDDITGCRKKTAFIQFLSSELQRKSDILLVCTAGINNLEEMNERIGIIKTDRYVKTFSDILQNSIISLSFSSMSNGQDSDIYRLNGSTFAFVLPQTAEKIIPLLFKKIRAECSRFSKTKVEPLSCALGYSVTNGVSTDVEKILQKSFSNMLLDRKNS